MITTNWKKNWTLNQRLRERSAFRYTLTHTNRSHVHTPEHRRSFISRLSHSWTEHKLVNAAEETTRSNKQQHQDRTKKTHEIRDNDRVVQITETCSTHTHTQRVCNVIGTLRTTDSRDSMRLGEISGSVFIKAQSQQSWGLYLPMSFGLLVQDHNHLNHHLNNNNIFYIQFSAVLIKPKTLQ